MKKINFFKTVTIVGIILTVINCSVYFYLYDKYNFLFLLLSGIISFIYFFVIYFYCKWTLSNNARDNEKKQIGSTYAWLIFIEVIPIINIMALLVMIIDWITTYFQILSNNNKIDYNGRF